MLIVQNAVIALVTAITLVLVAISTASARPNTNAFSCDGLNDLIAQKGAVVLNTKSSSKYQVYGRFVANRSYCRTNEVLLGFKVPTKTNSCKLKMCIKSEND